jgi:hypothetical protein
MLLAGRSLRENHSTEEGRRCDVNAGRKWNESLSALGALGHCRRGVQLNNERKKIRWYAKIGHS